MARRPSNPNPSTAALAEPISGSTQTEAEDLGAESIVPQKAIQNDSSAALMPIFYLLLL
jgi:hypothetical protein